jgi:hypothetical protein
LRTKIVCPYRISLAPVAFRKLFVTGVQEWAAPQS